MWRRSAANVPAEATDEVNQDQAVGKVPDPVTASEAIMNGLRGIDVEVIQIGSTTCGKPAGSWAWPPATWKKLDG